MSSQEGSIRTGVDCIPGLRVVQHVGQQVAGAPSKQAQRMRRVAAHLACPSAAGSWLAWFLLRILRGMLGFSAT